MNKKTEALLSLKKYWLRAALMRDHFYKESDKVSMPINEQSRANFRVYHHPLCTYLDYWFSGLFCVYEGYQKLKITIPEIDWITRCDPNLIKYLKTCRYSTYHFKIDGFKKISKFKSAEHLASMELIHMSLGEYLFLALKNISILSLLNKSATPPQSNIPQKSYSDLPSINNDGSENFMLLVGYFLIDYWKRANLFKDLFYKSLTECKTSNDYIAVGPTTYMDYWCATLNVVIEGYKRLGDKYSKIDKLLQFPHSSYLRDYRNATFRYHKSYFNVHLIYNLITQQDLLEWLNTLHEAFALYVQSKAEEFFTDEKCLKFSPIKT